MANYTGYLGYLIGLDGQWRRSLVPAPSGPIAISLLRRQGRQRDADGGGGRTGQQPPRHTSATSSGSLGEATVIGAGSKWSNNGSGSHFRVGGSGTGGR